MAAPAPSRLDANQVLQGSYDESTGRLRTDSLATVVNADIDVSGSTNIGLDAATLAALESITVQNGVGAAAVNIQDGGNSITVDAIDLDVRDLTHVSDSVKIGDGTEYSHVYFGFKSSKYEVDMIYQSSSTMLNYMSKEVFLLHNIVIKEFELEITDEQYDSLMQNCMKSAGLPYGTMQIIGIFLAEIFNMQENAFSDDEKYHCSEWVAEELEKLGYKFDKELDLVKPIDVYWVLDYENKS